MSISWRVFCPLQTVATTSIITSSLRWRRSPVMMSSTTSWRSKMATPTLGMDLWALWLRAWLRADWAETSNVFIEFCLQASTCQRQTSQISSSATSLQQLHDEPWTLPRPERACCGQCRKRRLSSIVHLLKMRSFYWTCPWDIVTELTCRKNRCLTTCLHEVPSI